MRVSSSPHPAAEVLPDLHEAIRRRAEEIYVQNGCIPGRDLENWSRAEREIMAGVARLERRTAVVICVKGVQYIGEYSFEASHGYVPGEFSRGAKVPVRFAGDKMFVRSPNGKELETLIVEKFQTGT